MAGVEEMRNSDVTDHDLKSARRILYISHFFREFTQWSFQFSLIFWFTKIESGLFLISVYQSITRFSILILVPKISRWIDEAAAGTSIKRNQFASRAILAQNASLFAVTIVIGFAMNITENDALLNCLVGISCLFGASAEVLYQIMLITMERDWVIVMANEDDIWLQKTNVGLKQIQLLCTVMSPAITGKILTISKGIFWIDACIISSSLIQYICIEQVYQRLPSLQQNYKEITSSTNEENETDDGDDESTPPGTWPCQRQISVYTSQKMVWAGVALALLYSNVLTFGGLMTTYLVNCGMPITTVGIWKGVSSLMGLFGTVVYDQALKVMDLETTGLLSLVWQFLCLTVARIFIADSDLSATLLIAGVLPSRMGLYSYDISLAQLFQRSVPPSVRGLVGGQQTSLNAMFEYMSFVLGMIYSDVGDFPILATIGYMSVGVAMAFYYVGIYLPYKNGAYENLAQERCDDDDLDDTDLDDTDLDDTDHDDTDLDVDDLDDTDLDDNCAKDNENEGLELKTIV